MAHIEVKWTRSAIGRPKDQRATLRGLGLNRMQKTVKLEDTPSIRGMVKKVIHLVEYKEVD